MSEIPEGATHKSEEGNYIKASGEDVSCFINDEWESVSSWAMLGAMKLSEIKQDKEMDIDWSSKDAEGFNFALYCEEVDIVNFYTYEPSHSDERWSCESTVFDGYPSYPHYKLHTRPKAKEMIYTKEMQEAGELPKLGMSFTFKGGSSDYIAKVIGLAVGSDHIQVVTFEYTDSIGMSGIECAFFDKSVFHSIDTRTDKQKTIENVELALNEKMYESNKSIAIYLVNKIYNSEFEMLSFTGDKNSCEEIQVTHLDENSIGMNNN